MNLEKVKKPTDIKGHIIIAPHPDDEIIGAFSILKEKPIIIYMGDIDQKRREEALKLKEHTDIGMQLFLNSVPNTFINKNTTLYFPDPSNEIHFQHRIIGTIGEQILRNGFDVIFYSTNMNVPYIRELPNWQEKEELLNKVYPSQKSLWEYEKKYVLFQGLVKWIM